MVYPGYSGTFAPPEERVQLFLQRVLPYIQAQEPLQVLDIGCGTGQHLAALARALPQARLTGIDISVANIHAAEATIRILHEGHRLTFLAKDFREMPDQPFHLIISDSVFHLINAPTETLFRKVANCLIPGGILACTLPYNCWFNRSLWALRRLFRGISGFWTDSFILVVAKCLHGQRYSEEFLRERLAYMYILPYCFDGPQLRGLLLEELGFALLAAQNLPHTSLAQPKHRLLILQKNIHAN